jgi:hypothetical protein
MKEGEARFCAKVPMTLHRPALARSLLNLLLQRVGFRLRRRLLKTYPPPKMEYMAFLTTWPRIIKLYYAILAATIEVWIAIKIRDRTFPLASRLF